MALQSLCNKFIRNQVVKDLVAGASTGILCVAINQPIDVIKTNVQGLNAHKYSGTIDCARQIVRSEGILGLYKGVKPRMARVAIEVSVTFASYNVIKDLILKYLDSSD